jgi:hypothetical protein
MPTLLRGGYAPPGVYTQTFFGVPPTPTPIPDRLPVFIGTGTEILSRSNLPVVRGSSSTIDQQVVDEDEAGRAVTSVSPSGVVSIGAFDGVITKFQVRNLPIVSGDGTGTPAVDTSAVSCRVNGFPTVVLGLDAAKGIVEIAVAPQVTDIVRCTYFFDRSDTLTTDDVSDQITQDAAVIDGLAGQTFAFVLGANDVFSISVDGLAFVNIVMPSSAPSVSGAVVAATINGAAGIGSLVASTYVNNLAQVCIRLSADKSIVIGTGTANTTLGFTPNTATARNRVFYTFQGPIVDGTGGGITTTDPSRIVVLVDGIQVIPTAVNGSARSFTLPYAPALGSTVTVRYFFNTWQDTFDYLANINVTAITRVALTPDGSTAGTFLQGVSYVLKDDVIVWGTAALISAATHTEGGATLGTSQIQAMLVDNQIFLAPCTPTVNSTGPVSVESRTVFQLPYQPTTGNGRGNPLGSALYQVVSNGRIDLPTTRPDLITAYWGFGVQDAIDRGPVTVLKVDSTTSQITLSPMVPEGASVFASFYYNTLVDMANIGTSSAYTLTCVTAGPGGIGTYSLKGGSGASLFGASLTAKGTDLTTVEIVFPSGSEFFPDARVEGAAPVEETVQVEFATSDLTPARFTNFGPGPYYTIDNTSDRLRVTFDGVPAFTGIAAGVDLSSPTAGTRAGAFAHLLGEEIKYTAASGETTYDLTSGVDDAINLLVDGVPLAAATGTVLGATAANFVSAINASAVLAGNEPYYNGAGTFTAFTVTAGEYDQLTLHYTGDVNGPSGNQTITLAPGAYVSVGALVAQINTQLATINGAGFLLGSVTASALASGQVRFTLAIGTASDLLTFGGIPLNTETVTIDGKVYTFQTVLTNVDGNVLIGGSAAASLSNLIAAITLGAGAGVTYAAATTLHPTVTAVAGTVVGTMLAKAKASGSAGNTIAVSTTVTLGVWATATLLGGDDAGYLEFITNALLARDFAVLAGIDTDTATNSNQTKIYNGPIARRYTVATTAGRLPYDRILLRNRIFPGGNSLSYVSTLAQTGITLQGGTGMVKSGLINGETAEAVFGANVKAPTIIAYTGWADGQVATATYGDARDGQANVIFYDGTDPSNPANNLLTFTAGGGLVTVIFTASTLGTATAFGPVTIAGSVLGQINAAIVAAGLSATVQVLQEGAAARLVGGGVNAAATLVIGAGSSNDTLGFAEDDSAAPTPVSTRQFISALMGHTAAASFVASMLSYALPVAGYFPARALAGIQKDSTGNVFLYFQSQTLGVGSSINFDNATTNNSLVTGTLLLITSADGSSGEAAINGFFVTSSNPSLGSGSADTSVFNSGVGQDGVVGQTYRDEVTGLVFTILPRAGGLPYPTGANATLTFRVSKTFTTDGNIPTLAIPGLELTVTNTSLVVVGDTAFIETFKKTGDEPTIGEIYYVSYLFRKQDFSPKFFSRLSEVVAEYGPVSPDNPLSLAAFLAFLNGSSIIATYQVLKEPGSSQASEQSYLNALVDLEGDSLPGNISPTVLVFLTPATPVLTKFTAIHCDVQSSIRYRAERTAIFGFASGTQPSQAGALAQATGATRVRFVYPDIATITLTDVLGASKTYLVDGRYIAGAVASSTTAPSIDSATPWTGRLLSGFTTLARSLDAVEANQVASRGVTVIEERLPFMRIRHGLTSDMSNTLTKLPTVIQIADDMQRRARAVLDAFIGVKFLPQILGQIEGQLSEMFKRAVQGQIITSFTGVSVILDPEDPTAVLVEAFYIPVFPLLYIQLTFRVSSQSATV